MLRAALAAAVTAVAIGLIGTPTAGAHPHPRPCPAGKVCGANKPPNYSDSPRAIAVHRIAKHITDNIRHQPD